MIINTVKYTARIKTPTVHTGYLINGTRGTDIGSGDRYELAVIEWLKTNTAEAAYTQKELNEYIKHSEFNALIAAIAAITVEYQGNIYNGSADAQIKLASTITKINGKSSVDTRVWFTADMNKVHLTKDDFIAIIDLIDVAQEALAGI